MTFQIRKKIQVVEKSVKKSHCLTRYLMFHDSFVARFARVATKQTLTYIYVEPCNTSTVWCSEQSIMSGADDGILRIWDLRSNEIVKN